MRPLLLAALAALALVGCNPMEKTTRTRAANDFKCTEEQIQVVNIGGTSYRASGCGKEATYNCVQSTRNATDIACAREEQHVEEKAGPPPTAPATPAPTTPAPATPAPTK